MPTLTLDLPEATYQDALAFNANERVRLFAVALRTARDFETDEDSTDEEDESLPDYDRPTNETDLESIGRSLADVAAGRIIPGEIVLDALMKQAKRGRK